MKANAWRFYITPFLDSGAYGSEIEVTKDVDFSSLGALQFAFDNADYDVGILRNSNISVTLNNRLGIYSDVDVIESIFRYSRANSKVRITWSLEENPNYAGQMVAGQTVLCSETTIFSGLLDDTAAQMSLSDHKIPFSFLGLESLFDKAIVPFSSLSLTSIKNTIVALLNQSAITSYLTVSGANITVGADQTLDAFTSYQNKTVKDALNDLLLISSSILYIQNSIVYVKPRTAGVTSQKTFYGQASFNGVENIIAIDGVNSGFARIYNSLTWQNDPTIAVQSSASILNYKVRTKQFGVDFFTNSTKINTLLAVFLTEFSAPRQEYVLTCALDFTTQPLWVLNRVTVDYPPMVVPASSGDNLPICGIAICGAANLPRRLSNFATDLPTDFKIMDIEIELTSGLMKFKLRKI